MKGGENGCRRLSTLCGGTFGLHATGSGEQAPRKVFPLALRPFNFNGWIGGEGGGVSAALY